MGRDPVLIGLKAGWTPELVWMWWWKKKKVPSLPLLTWLWQC